MCCLRIIKGYLKWQAQCYGEPCPTCSWWAYALKSLFQGRRRPNPIKFSFSISQSQNYRPAFCRLSFEWSAITCEKFYFVCYTIDISCEDLLIFDISWICGPKKAEFTNFTRQTITIITPLVSIIQSTQTKMYLLWFYHFPSCFSLISNRTFTQT